MSKPHETPEEQAVPHPDAAEGSPGMRLSKRLSMWAGLGAAAIGIAGLIGWAWDIETLKCVLPGLVSMKANTAVDLVLMGLSVWLCAIGGPNRFGVARVATLVLSGAAGLIGGMTLGEYALGWDLGIDELLFRDPSPLGTTHPGRMGINTAFSFMLIAAAVWIGGSQNRCSRCVSNALAAATGLIAYIGLLGYLYSINDLIWPWYSTQMAVHTTGAFLLLAAGVLWAQPSPGLIHLLTSQTSGAMMARRVLPAVVLLPTALGWLHGWSEQRQFFNSAVNSALLIVCSIVGFGAVVWLAMTQLDRVDHMRIAAERKRDQLLAKLSYRAHTLESEVKKRSEDLNHLFMISYDLLCIANFQGYFTRVSPSFTQTLGYTEEELLRTPFIELVHPEDRESTAQQMRALNTGQVTISFSNRYVCKDGGIRWLEWNSVPVPSKGLIYAVARDVTLRRQAEEDVQRHIRQLREKEARLHEQALDLMKKNRELEAARQAADRAKSECCANKSHEALIPRPR